MWERAHLLLRTYEKVPGVWKKPDVFSRTTTEIKMQIGFRRILKRVGLVSCWALSSNFQAYHQAFFSGELMQFKCWLQMEWLADGKI